MTKVLLISPIPTDGTAFVRVAPYTRIPDIETIYFDGDTSWPKLWNIDVAVVQRPPDQHTVIVMEELKRFNIPIIVDWDDAIFCIDKTNPVYDYYSEDEKQESMREATRMADVVTVSTKALKEHILKYIPTATVEVIENAVDDYFFDTTPSYHKRNKIIAIRGGSSHVKDWGQYKDTIIEIMKEHPDYSLAVMGYHPEWLREVPNVKLYEFESIPKYFDKLMELKPEIAIVPLEDSEFNRCKSNLAWQEFTVAGAMVLASALPEFNVDGCICFNNSESLKDKIDYLIKSDYPYIKEYYERSIHVLPKVSVVNEKRRDLIERLTKIRQKKKPLVKTLPPATALQFHNHELSHGYTNSYPIYNELSKLISDYFISEFKLGTALELGCGTGGTLLNLLKKGIIAYGYELNPYSVNYFYEHYPLYKNQVIQTDITTEKINNDTVGDLVYSIEVFEHINKPESWWEGYIMDLSFKFKNFYFSSTPYYSKESFDNYWGHTNIRLGSQWITLFERSGWKFVKQPRIATQWDLQFKSVNVA